MLAGTERVSRTVGSFAFLYFLSRVKCPVSYLAGLISRNHMARPRDGKVRIGVWREPLNQGSSPWLLSTLCTGGKRSCSFELSVSGLEPSQLDFRKPTHLCRLSPSGSQGKLMCGSLSTPLSEHSRSWQLCRFSAGSFLLTTLP